MILTCPACQTRFAINAAALGDAGRKVRCAKCGDNWHQMPEEDPPAPAPKAAKAAKPKAAAAPPKAAKAEPDDPAPGDGPSDDEDNNGGGDGDGDGGDAGETDSVDDAENAPKDSSEAAAGPEDKKLRRAKDRAKRAAGRVVASGKDSDKGGRKRGLIGWLVLLLVFAGIGGGGFFYQEKIVEIWLPAGQLYDMLGNGAEPEKFGLAIQNVKWEHKWEKGKPVLVVHGDVTNISEKLQSVPRLRVIIRDEKGRRLFRWTVTTALNKLEPGAGTAFTTRLANPPDGARSLAVTFLVQP